MSKARAKGLAGMLPNTRPHIGCILVEKVPENCDKCRFSGFNAWVKCVLYGVGIKHNRRPTACQLKKEPVF